MEIVCGPIIQVSENLLDQNSIWVLRIVHINKGLQSTTSIIAEHGFHQVDTLQFLTDPAHIQDLKGT